MRLSFEEVLQGGERAGEAPTDRVDERKTNDSSTALQTSGAQFSKFTFLVYFVKIQIRYFLLVASTG